MSIQLELTHDRGREVNPTGAQLGKSDRLIAGRRSRSSSRCCWVSASVIDWILTLAATSAAPLVVVTQTVP